MIPNGRLHFHRKWICRWTDEQWMIQQLLHSQNLLWALCFQIDVSELDKLAFQRRVSNCLHHLSLTFRTVRRRTKHRAAVRMCCVWVSGPNQIDTDASATKLRRYTSFSHSPPQLCQDYTVVVAITSPSAASSVVVHTLYKQRGINVENPNVWRRNRLLNVFTTMWPSHYSLVIHSLIKNPTSKQPWSFSNSCFCSSIITILMLKRGQTVTSPSLYTPTRWSLLILTAPNY